MSHWIKIARLSVISALIFPVFASAQYEGNIVEADYRYPTVSTNYAPAGGPFSETVSNAVEFGFFGGGSPNVDVSGNNILITYVFGFGLDPSDNDFDGIVITSISPSIPDIVGVRLNDTNIPGVVGLTFDARNVYIDQDTLVNSFEPGAYISVDVQFYSEPVPALSPMMLTLMLLLLGATGAFLLRRRV